LPSLGNADFGAAGAPALAPGAVPTPPPLTGLSIGSEAATTQTAATTATAASVGPVNNYEFLFRDDADIGVVREKYSYEDAEKIKQGEISRFITKYQVPGQQQQQQGQDPRAGAEFDFYFEQFELYNRYVKERLLPEVTDLPTPTYDAANYLQERQDLQAEYNKAALELVNDQSEENQDFYDRLQQREDRRRAYYEWIVDQQRELDEWAQVWARRVNGLRWNTAPEQQPVRRDDWYYGVNFASADPKIVHIEGQEYVVSQDPQRKVSPTQLNVISSNLTPYDIIDRNGQMKNPNMERLRGTIVHSPDDLPVTGTLEMVPAENNY
jgi:hypothetical protein